MLFRYSEIDIRCFGLSGLDLHHRYVVVQPSVSSQSHRHMKRGCETEYDKTGPHPARKPAGHFNSSLGRQTRLRMMMQGDDARMLTSARKSGFHVGRVRVEKATRISVRLPEKTKKRRKKTNMRDTGRGHWNDTRTPRISPNRQK